MHPDNGFYGHRAILSRYCGHREERTIWGHVQHGWTGDWPMASRGRIARWLPVFAWNATSVRTTASLGVRRVVPIGAPFLYLMEQLPPTEVMDPEAVLFYPFHSTDSQGEASTHDQTAAHVVERFGPSATVCLYWTDHAEERVRAAYEDRGLVTVCHGRRDDPEFLRNQWATLSRFGRVASNRACTALWYGGAMGRSIEIFEPSPPAGLRDLASGSISRPDLWRALCAGNLSVGQSRELALAELGAGHVRAPDELEAILGTGRPSALGAVGRAAVHADHHARTAWWYLRTVRSGDDARSLAGRIRRKSSMRDVLR